MAGHSKWANIKHRKGRQDAIKGKIFTKLIRAITVAARQGGGDVSTNPNLRLAVDKALIQNMTRDTIDRAIKRGVGTEEGVQMETIYYEGYGPGGVAVLVECMTDNRNRTVGEVRHAFTKYHGNLGSDGSVAYLFNKRGVITFPPGEDTDEDKIMEIAIDNGAEDVITNPDGSIDVFTSPENFAQIRDALQAEGLETEHAEIAMVPTTEVTLDINKAESMLKLIEVLEDLDDVQNIYHNADIPDEIMETENFEKNLKNNPHSI
jgi:YebC/PmpR family DNA-binding regulatory protein